MKRLIPLLLVLALAGCTNLSNAYSTLTGTVVTDQQVYLARNAFDAVEATATNYIALCRGAPKTPGCSRGVIAKLIPAVRSGRVARANIVQFQKDHPGQLGAAGLYDALVAATNTLQQIQLQYNTAGVTK